MAKCKGAAHSICNLKFNVPNEIPLVFITGQIMIIILGQFECLVEKTEKYKTSSLPLEKEVTKIEKDGTENLPNYLKK